MPADREKRELRVFLSSTFRDLQPEREELVKKTFPRIRKACRERGVEFTEIDLRWGITEEESRTGRTIRICLEEIDRCRPYFIGVIGSRYGWVPGISEVEKDEALLPEFPWLREYAESEKSIIEMEFAHGAMHQQNDSAFFYEQSGAVADDEALSTLKDSLQDASFPYRRFTDPEELGEQVYQDIVAILDRDFPQARELTPLEHERIEHESYARNRLQSYVANPEYYEIFEQRVNSTGAPLIVWGKSGLGKSALMAYFAHEYKQRHPEAFVVQHFIGAAEGSDPEDVIRQVMMEIKERYQLSDAIPSDDNALKEEFPIWLAKIREGEKLVLLIDALNQLTGIAPEMHWLPDFIPANIRLVVSTTTDSLPLEELRKRKWKELELKPLTEMQREAIASGFLERYSKTLPPEELRELAANPKTSSPLFLRTVLEELRIFGHHQSLHEELENYLSSEDERSLFQKVLARMERDHGAEALRSVMTAVWASRHGLSEAELMEITGFPRMALSTLMIAMEYHLMQREGSHTFFHNYLREAIERRYLPGLEARNAAHARLGEYFGTREFGRRRWIEEPWQWEQSGNLAKLKESLIRPQMVALFSTDHDAYEAYALWKSFPKIGYDAGYAQTLNSEEIGIETNFRAYKNIINLLITAGNYDAASEFLENGFPLFDGRIKAQDLLFTESTRAELEAYRNRFEPAIELASVLLEKVERTAPGAVELRLKLLDLESVCYYSLGKFDEAERIVRQGIEISNSEYGEQSFRSASEFKNLGAFLIAAKKLKEGEAACRTALSLYANIYGESHPETAGCRMNLGAALHYQARYDEARKEFKAAEEVFRSSLGPDHPLTLRCQHNIANLLAEQGKSKESRALAQDVLERRARVLGEGHLDTCSIGIFVGYTYYFEGEFGKAKVYYEKYFPIFVNITGVQHPDAVRFRARMEEIDAALNETTAQA